MSARFRSWCCTPHMGLSRLALRSLRPRRCAWLACGGQRGYTAHPGSYDDGRQLSGTFSRRFAPGSGSDRQSPPRTAWNANLRRSPLLSLIESHARRCGQTWCQAGQKQPRAPHGSAGSVQNGNGKFWPWQQSVDVSLRSRRLNWRCPRSFWKIAGSAMRAYRCLNWKIRVPFVPALEKFVLDLSKDGMDRQSDRPSVGRTDICFVERLCGLKSERQAWDPLSSQPNAHLSTRGDLTGG
jgi:hypothetical protein